MRRLENSNVRIKRHRQKCKATAKLERVSSARRCELTDCGAEGAGRGPAGTYVGEIEGVELGPENVALGAEGGMGLVLLFAGVCVLYDPGQREVGVFGGLRQTAGEIIE